MKPRELRIRLEPQVYDKVVRESKNYGLKPAHFIRMVLLMRLNASK